MKKVITQLITGMILGLMPAAFSAQTIAAGSEHSLSVCSDSTVKAWGYNFEGQLGDGTSLNSSNVPVSVSSLTGITAVAGGLEHSLALKNDSMVWAWGNNTTGELGNGTNIDSDVPVQVNGLTGIVAIAAGYDHSLAVKNDSTVWVWGRNNYGQLGNGNNNDYNVPVQVNGLTGIVAVAAI